MRGVLVVVLTLLCCPIAHATGFESELARVSKLVEANRPGEAARLLERTAARAEGSEQSELLSTAALLQYGAGAYREAVTVAKRALALVDKQWEGVNPELKVEVSLEPPDAVLPLAVLSEAHLKLSDISSAFAAARRSKLILDSGLGESHPYSALAHQALAHVYLALGATRAARAEAEAAVKLAEDQTEALKDIAGTGDGAALARHVLAEVLLQAGDLEGARRLVLEAEKLAPEGGKSVRFRNNLARLEGSLGKHAEAYAKLVEVTELLRRERGPRHPDLARALTNRAALALALDKPDEARTLLNEALSILTRLAGPEHVEVANTLNHLAVVEFATKRLDAGLAYLRRASDIRERALNRLESASPLAVLQPTLDQQRGALDLALTVALSNRSEPAAARLALDLVLRSKGRSVDAARARSRLVFQEFGAQDALLKQRLDESIKKLCPPDWEIPADGPARSTRTPEEERACSEHEDARDRARDAYSKAPTSLHYDLLRARRWAAAELSAGQPLSQESGMQLLALEDALNLALASAARAAGSRPLVALDAVEKRLRGDEALVEYVQFRTHDLLVPGALRRQGEVRVAAFVLRTDGVRLVDLGAWPSLERLIDDFRTLVLGTQGNYRPAARALYGRVLEPLEPLLGGVAHLYVAPDAELSLVPFDALRDDRGFLIDRPRTYSYLTSGRDLLRDPTPRGAPRVVAFADPDYGEPGAPGDEADPEAGEPAPRRTATATPRFTRVPNTGATARDILKNIRLPYDLYVGRDAAALRLLHDLHGPTILHVATHGFYDAAWSSDAFDELQAGDAALAHAGLALADANRGGSKGLVTALELAGTDLVGTELAVLATCESGRGATVSGHGAYTLYRSVLAAGAQTVLASLWRVNAQSTDDLVKGFYSGLVSGHSRLTALRDAMLAVRRSNPNPRYWAPFVVYGDPSVLQALAARTP